MIQVNALNKSYGKQTIFENVTFTLNPRERVGLVGRNGHGKTSLFRMLLGLEQPDSGNISVPVSYRLGHLSQHIQFTENTVLKEACLSIPGSEDAKDDTYKAETILMGLGFTVHDLTLGPEELSGGYQVRLNLAKVIVSDPNALLLDEPTNYLDILSLRWLAQFLTNWQKELIIITHDRSFMDSVTTHTMAIHRCTIKKVAGTTGKVYEQLLMEEEIYEKTRINDEKKRKEVEQFIDRFRAKATKAKAVQSRIKSLQKRDQLEELSEIRNLEFTFNTAPFTGKQLMEVKDLSFGFDPEGPPLIDSLSFYVGKRDRIAIIGKNGRGKTTLLKLLAGELTPQKGTVCHHKSSRLAYFGQTNIVRLNPHKTVEEEIMDAHPERSRGVSRGICGAMMFQGDNALKKINVLSGGEKSRVLLGKLLVSPANMLLLDEPTNHLDMESTESLLAAVEEFGGAVLLVTHSEMILHALATRLIVFDNGKVTFFEGTYGDFLDRIGWKNESEKTQPAPELETSPTRLNDRKKLRRRRAELINEKSRTLGSLQERINIVESEIIRLEERTEKENSALLEASMNGNGESIKGLSKSIHRSQSNIKTLFSELETLHAEFETKAREFEERINETAEQ